MTFSLKSICYHSFFALGIIYASSAAALSEQSFNAMYAAAADGNVEGLRAAVHRGLKIDSVNAKGDTGVCVAIKNSDYTAYNSFIMTGARTNPTCLGRITRSVYDKFINSNKVIRMGRNRYSPPVRSSNSRANNGRPYISDPQMAIIQRELEYTAKTGNAHNLMYLPASLLFSFIR